MSEGWVSLHRGWRDNPIFRGEFSRADAWIWLIESACWKPTRTRIKGETVMLDRGELSFALRFMADKWGWSKSRVDRFLCDLRAESMIKTRSKIGTETGHKAGQGQSIVTICNYAKYQDSGETNRDNGDTKTGTTAGQQRDKEEQGNKEISRIAPNGACASGDAPTLKPEHFVESWNDLAKRIGKPCIRDLTPERRTRVRARIAGYTLEDFRTVLGNVDRSPFLRGDMKWSGCTFDWITKKANFQKVLEGNYND